MPVRGQRSIWPSRGKAPTGIFSSKGKQKMDSTSQFRNKDDLAYAKGSSTRSKPVSSSAPRHQKHYGIPHK